MELSKETEGKWRRDVTQRRRDGEGTETGWREYTNDPNKKGMETEEAESKRSEPNPKTTQNGTVTEQ